MTVDGEKVFSASYCDYMISENVLQREKGLRTYAEGREGKVAHEPSRGRRYTTPPSPYTHFENAWTQTLKMPSYLLIQSSNL